MKEKVINLSKKNAIAMLYTFDKLQKMDNLDCVRGSQKTYLGVETDIDLFMKEMIQDNESQIGYNSLKKIYQPYFPRMTEIY